MLSNEVGVTYTDSFTAGQGSWFKTQPHLQVKMAHPQNTELTHSDFLNNFSIQNDRVTK